MFSDPTTPKLAPSVAEYYRNAMRHLNEAKVPFLVGGAYALAQYTDIERHTKDFDIFVREEHCEPAMAVLEKAGYRTEFTFPHWLGKAYHCGEYIDIIFNSGNGICAVDDDWFKYATDGTVLGMRAKLVPPEEMVWPKIFIMERERFDGADVIHLIKSTAKTLNWQRLLDRVGEHWRILMTHLILFGYVYPGHRCDIPEWVMHEMQEKLAHELISNDVAKGDQCQGTILSRAQYLIDIECKGYKDARIEGGSMTDDEISIWTAPIREAA